MTTTEPTTTEPTTTGRTPGPAKGYTPTDQHKRAMAVGRRQTKIVADYLEALDEWTPRRARPVSTEALEAKIAKIDATIDDLSHIARLHANQRRLDLQAELERLQAIDETDLDDLENKFVKVAAEYAERKGVSYQAFRQMGVPASTLKRAGITRS